MKVFVLCLALAFTVGCSHAPSSIQTPAGTVAYHNLQVVKALDVIRDTAVAANAQTPPLLSTATTRAIVQFHQSALTVIQSTPQGWRTIVQTSLTETQKHLTLAEHQQLDPYFALAATLIQTVGV